MSEQEQHNQDAERQKNLNRVYYEKHRLLKQASETVRLLRLQISALQEAGAVYEAPQS